MMAMVAAGLALGLAGASQIAGSREPGIVARPLAGRPPLLTTYWLRLDGQPSENLSRFIERAVAVEKGRRAPPLGSNADEEIEP